MANARKYNQWSLVLNLPKDNPDGLTFEELADTMRSSCLGLSNSIMTFEPFAYALIVHDLDKDEISQQLKTEHMHLVMLLSKAHTLNEVLLFICQVTGLPANCVSLEHVRSLGPAIRYLTHKDNPDKATYLPSDIIANNDWWLPYWESGFDYVRDIYDPITEGADVPYFIKKFGKTWYLSNRLLILDTLKAVHYQ